MPERLPFKVLALVVGAGGKSLGLIETQERKLGTTHALHYPPQLIWKCVQPSKNTVPDALNFGRTAAFLFRRGHVGPYITSVKDDYQHGEEQGKKDILPFTFTLTIASQDVEATVTDPQHEARMVDTVIAPALSPHPLTVNNGKFNLFVVGPT